MLLVVVCCVIALHALPGSCREVLPPSAYENRTIYPALIDYKNTKRGTPNLAIGLLSDVQYAEREEVGRRHFKLSLGKLKHAVNEFNVNRTHLDLVIHLGDLVDSDMATNLPKLQPILDELRFPLYQVLGNHDFLGSPEASFENIYKMLKMPSRYYSLNAGPNKRYRLIMLDGNDLAMYSTATGSKKRKEAEQILAGLKRRRARNAKPFNGALGTPQIDWLKEQLLEACDAGQQAFLFIHHPMRPKDEPTNLWNDIAIVPIVTSYHCVAAVINGHAHKFLYDYHHTKHRHVHFVTFGGMVQSPFTTFGFADIYDDCLHIHGLIFGREIDLHYNISYNEQPTKVETPEPTLESTRNTPPPTVTVASAPLRPETETEAATARTESGATQLVATSSDFRDPIADSRRLAALLTTAALLLAAVALMRLRKRRLQR